MANPLVSVIIPVYNKEATVVRTIQSVLDQTWKDVEIIVVDDGSTDGSFGVAREALDGIEGDKRYRGKFGRVISKDNEGVAIARNTGVLKYSHGHYIVCLDSDDAIEREYLEYLATALSDDKEVDIVYTILHYIKPDGERGNSPWPRDFDRNGQFRGQNQVPTAAMARRSVWTTLGGQRRRYSPAGAGAEDAEFWLRAITYGHKPKFLPYKKNARFLYSWLSGLVSGDPNYREENWRAWAPWCERRELMPTPSLASPTFFSHAARYYDEPGISVIIPVGPNHAGHLVDALDSLDAQTYKHWEAIVVFDVDSNEWIRLNREGVLKYLENTWPACRWMSVNSDGKTAREIRDELDVLDKGGSLLLSLPPRGLKPAGAGRARNAGIKRARASLLFFLDADDYLVPDALEKFMTQYAETPGIIFSEHYGMAYIAEDDIKNVLGRVIVHDKRIKPQIVDGVKKYRTVIHQSVGEYDCKKTMEQPYTDGRAPYVPCMVSSLVPKKWAEEVGLFPETWESWEDVLFFWRLAWSGKCFYRVPEPLLVYRYYAGERRDRGLSNAKELLQRLDDISRKTEKMGCNCGKQTSRSAAAPQTQGASMQGGSDIMATLQLTRGKRLNVRDEDMILIQFDPVSKGDSQRFGKHDFGGGNFISYGRRAGGEQFYVHKNDLMTEQNIAAAQGRSSEYILVTQVDPSAPDELKEVEEMDAPEELGLFEPEDDWNFEFKLPEPDSEVEIAEIEFPEPAVSLGRLTPIGDMDVDMKNPDRYVAIFLSQDPPIETALDLIRYDEEYEQYNGLELIEGIGPAARKAFLDAARKLY